MTDGKSIPIIVFGKLAGLGILLLGISALVFASGFFITVANQAHESQASPAEEPATKSDFQILQLGSFRRDQFLVDKSTGRVWQSFCSGQVDGPDCKGMLIWDEMYVGGITPSGSAADMAFLHHISAKQ